jgi:membrane-associated phospholipid phosphatase
MSHLTQQWPIRAGRTSWLIAAGAAIAGIALLSLVDAELSLFGRGLPAPLVEVFRWITLLGDSGYILIPSLVLFIASALLALVIPKPVPKQALWQMAGVWAFLFLGVGFPSLATTIIKRFIGRARPDHMETAGSLGLQPMSWVDWTYQSFPSGHATTAFALCFVVSFLAPKSYPWMLAFAVLVALSRVIVGAHYPTDLVAGAIVGTLGAYLVRNLFAWRGWVFERLPDGGIAMRPLAAVRDLIERRRG